MSQPAPIEPRGNGRPREILAIVVMAFAVLTIVSLHSSASGVVGVVLSTWLRSIFGHGADIPALFLFIGGVSLLRRRVPEGRGRRGSAVLLFFLVCLSAYHTILTGMKGPLSPYWATQVGFNGEAGGYVGAFLSARLLSAFGPWGSAVVMIALAFVAVILYLETPFSRILSYIVRSVIGLLRRIVTAITDFVTGTGHELRDLVGSVRDRREQAAARRQMRSARRSERQESKERHRDVERTPKPSEESLVNKAKRLFAVGSDEVSDELPDRSSKTASTQSPPRGARGLAAVLEDAKTDGKSLRSAARAARREQVADTKSEKTPEDPDDHEESGVDEAYQEYEERALESAPDAPSDQQPVERGTQRSVNGASQRGASGAAAESEASSNQPLPLALEPETEVTYTVPPTAILHRAKESGRVKKGAVADQSQLLEETLATFGVQAKVVRASRGPVVTRYELQPAPGIKVSKIVNLADDVALNLAAADVRIEAPVPGKSVVGIEIPNKETTTVYIREVLESPEFKDSASKLVVGLGKDIAGNVVVADLTKLLHVLIAGATGSGKSVCINSIICSILFKARPDEVKLLMIDPKRVELAVYDGVPHLITPVVTDPKMAANALRWAVKEMESRYKKFSEAGVRNITGYNQQVEDGVLEDQPMPYLVVIIDELADLMLVAANEVEDSICRLAQMARAAGIHLIIATQRPSVDVITGLIKANVPSRIAFAVSSGVDSRTILDTIGAERLIGKGDMLYYPIGANKPSRAQGAWIFDKEVQATVDFWKKQGEPAYASSVTEVPKAQGSLEEGDDELFDDAVQLVVDTGNASISMLQRRFRIGYARAARLIDMMELQGIVGPYQGSKPREVLRSVEESQEIAN